MFDFFSFSDLGWIIPIVATGVTCVVTAIYKVIKFALKEHYRVCSSIDRIPEILDELKEVKVLGEENQFEIRQANGRLATTLNHFPMPTFICDLDGKNISVNDAYCEVLECSRDELLKFGWKSFCINNGEWEETWRPALKEKREAWAQVHLKSKINQRVMIFQCYLWPVKNGEVREFYGSFKQLLNNPHKDDSAQTDLNKPKSSHSIILDRIKQWR